MSEFNKNKIKEINNLPNDIGLGKEWTSEVVFRLKYSCKAIEDIYLLKESFTLETEGIARAAFAETKVLTTVLTEALNFHEENDALSGVLKDAYQETMPSVDKAVEQYQSIKKWFDN